MQSFNHFRTDSMAWEPDPGIPGFLAKYMFLDDKTGQFTNIHYVPPGWGDEILKGKPYRHYHQSVYERSFCLFGDFPHWEFKEPADTAGEQVTFGAGTFMDRPPLTIHGLLPQPKSQTGATTLSWNTGGGTSVDDPRAKDETFPVPFNDFHGSNLKFTSPRIFPTSEVAWQQHPTIHGWKIKRLCERNAFAQEAVLVSIPPDWLTENPRALPSDGERRWVFVMSGDLAVAMTDNDATTELLLGERDYLDWFAPSVATLGGSRVTSGGAVILCVGHNLS